MSVTIINIIARAVLVTVLLGIFFDLENGGSTFLRYIIELLDYTMSHPE
jgi:hypothetical protein